MSEREFELYLSLLSRLLRLNPQQRAEIADELRDHFDERFRELTAQGLDRDEAIRQTLDEFGDAAGLAAHFSQIARRRKRRWIMRFTFGSMAALTAGILGTIALWPEPEIGDVPPQAAAQQKEFSSEGGQYMSGARPEKKRSSKTDTAQARVEAKLQQPIAVKFSGAPLAQALQSISDEIEVDILVNEGSLNIEGISTDESIDLQLKYTEVPAKTALQLILEPLNLGHRIRDGFVYVETQAELEEALEVRVYNCRDLLAGVEPKTEYRSAGFGCGGGGLGGGGFGGGGGGGFGGGGGGGFFSVGDAPDPNRRAPTIVLFQFEGGGAEGDAKTEQTPKLGGGLGAGCSRPQVQRTTPAEQLIEVITNETSGEWQMHGGHGTIDPFNGLLVVRQTQQVHREIEQLLEMLREADRQDRGAEEENAAPVEEEVSAFGESEAPRSTNPLRKPRKSTPVRKPAAPAAPEKK